MNSFLSNLAQQNLAAQRNLVKISAAIGIVLVGAVPIAIALTPTPSQAQTSYYYAGEVQGEKILVDLNSINAADANDANFEYLQGDDSISAQAHCTGADAWTTLEDGTTHYAQSQANQNMVRIVCSYLNQSPASGSTIAVTPPPAPEPVSSPPLPIEPLVSLPVEPAPSELPTPIEPPTPSDDGVAIAVEPYSAAEPESSSNIQTALVYDPSSNVRATPNGQILCSIDTVSYINIYGQVGDWYDTDACGSAGLIHISQISFTD